MGKLSLGFGLAPWLAWGLQLCLYYSEGIVPWVSSMFLWPALLGGPPLAIVFGVVQLTKSNASRRARIQSVLGLVTGLGWAVLLAVVFIIDHSR